MQLELGLEPQKPRRRDDLAAMARRHRRWAQVLGKLGIAALSAKDPSEIRPADAVRLVLAAVEIERAATELLDGQIEVDLASLPIEELERLARG